MSDSPKHHVSRFLFAVTATGCLIAGPSHADNIYVSDTKISVVTVTGGADTANPGTTCMKVQAAVLPACGSKGVKGGAKGPGST